MVARVTTFALDGIEPRRVTVEVDVNNRGLPAFNMVGLGDRAVREARERTRAAIKNSHFPFPEGRITVNLAPASMRKTGPGFDLAIAVGIIVADAQIPDERLTDLAVFGELSLGGEVRACRGALAVAEGTIHAGLTRIVLPRAHITEAALVEGIEVVGVESLGDVADLLLGEDLPVHTIASCPPAPRSKVELEPDLRDVRGQPEAISALEVAAAGGHNLLMVGPPGAGKTMLARRLPSILPPLTREEALEVTRIHGVAGTHAGGLVDRRPFRAPHHSASASALTGGGSVPAPGEASLAHHGVLFLDEMSEFRRDVLDALRQPLEDGRVAVVRGQKACVFPTRFMLVAATNPCPCGFLGTDDGRCACTEAEIARYRRRLSGPLLDRLDLLVAVQRVRAEDMQAAPFTSSAASRERVMAARERAQARLSDTGVPCNAQMPPALVDRLVELDDDARHLLSVAHERNALSARAHHRVLRVARTVADLEGSGHVSRGHVAVALSMRGAEAGGKEVDPRRPDDRLAA